MLPVGVNPVAQIEQEKNPATQVIQLVSLLEYLLGFISPGMIGKDGKPATVGERVDANRALFTNPPDVFFGIGVRNHIVHAKAADVTEAEIKRAASHLFNAVNEIRTHRNIPENVRQAAFAASASQAASAPTRPVTTSTLPPAPPRPNFAPIGQSSTSSSTPAAATSPVNTSPSFTTKVTPRQTMTPDHMISTRQIRNTAIVVALLAAAVFLAKPVWHWSKEKIYGSEENTRITRTQAETTLKFIRGQARKPGFAAKAIEAETAWRDAEIAFNQGKFKEAEPIYRRVLQIGDELALRETEHKDAQQFFNDMNKAREAARVAQAPQYATAAWQDAENLKRSAETALRNADLSAAKQTALQAQQKYEEAKLAAEAAPKPEPSPTPTPATPTPGDQPSGDPSRVRPRPETE